MSLALYFAPATSADLAALQTLINRAYRGTDAAPGWTHEAHLLSGPRTDAPALQALLTTPGARILTARDAAGALVGSVYLEAQPPLLYLGLLAVDPARQAGGIGRQLLAAAEDYARRQGLSAVQMTVLAERPDLLAWYARRGYRPTGETRPLHAEHGAGQTRQQLTLQVLAKAVEAKS
ncbi:GNAT family N-acetyltransferase [Hymenobacter gummosus]|uniref:GNAT family N-acetyltransferase n=1 Tax=Hymenobacter gummosus TaxID=1776032 RepID=A0A3S0H2L0_9BACT|nr:GNAT family N-acetyltransferase [Hymenobacter gummosus]RTQ46870.1 GNAT family N-acetyltransferase [Hymenobacter gummosus]